MSSLSSEFQVYTGGHNKSRRLIPTASSLLSRAFLNDPVIRYMLSSMPAGKRAAYLPKYFAGLLTAATLNRGSIEYIADRIGNAAEEDGEGGKAVHDEGGEWKCCGVLMPPGEAMNNPWTLLPAGLLGAALKVRWGGCVRMLIEYPSLVNAAKKKGLKGQKLYYYVFALGTEVAAQGQGFGSTILREYQARASKEGLPIWLESTTEKSRRLYSKLGWEVVEELLLGKGKAKADGTLTKGGEGVKCWTMVWWPPAPNSGKVSQPAYSDS